MAGEHAFLPPSAAARWSVCALSASLEAAHPETEESIESAEGTAAHWVLQMTVEGRPPAIGTQAPNGVATTRDMLEGADLALAAFERHLGPHWRQVLVVEERVAIPDVHPSLCWGTPDGRAWLTLADGRQALFVFEYKFGRALVPAYRNKQLVAYASGAMTERRINGLTDARTVVVLVVIQPRSYHREGPVRHWATTGEDLRGYINGLYNGANAATMQNPQATPQPEACKDCRGRLHCSANQRASYYAAAQAEQAHPINLTPQQLGLELRNLSQAQKLLTSRIKGLEAEAEALLRRGERVPFWALESAPGRLEWTKSAQEVLALGDACGIKLGKPVEPITPTQAKTAGVPEATISLFAKRAASSAKLTYDDGTDVARVFGGI